MAPGRSLLREEIRDTLAEAMIKRTEAKYRANGMHFNPSWFERREIESAASDLAAALWERFYAEEPS